jgi:hypothetical protein
MRGLLPLLPLLVAAAALSAPATANDNSKKKPNFSEAERALFMSDHLAAIKPPTTLRYAFRKSGSLEPGFDDKVSLMLTKQADGSCCDSKAEFLDGPRRLVLPEVQGAHGNPVILYFLERDVREMSRLTKGQSSYFRKRIRMAVFQGASVRETSVSYGGKTVRAREIRVAPYSDDPLRVRFETLADKQYVFTLSDAVPGGVVAIVGLIKGAGAAGGDTTPLLREELRLDGASFNP